MQRYSDGFSGVSKCGGTNDTHHHAKSLPRQDPEACGSPVAAGKRPLSPEMMPRQDRTTLQDPVAAKNAAKVLPFDASRLPKAQRRRVYAWKTLATLGY